MHKGNEKKMREQNFDSNVVDLFATKAYAVGTNWKKPSDSYTSFENRHVNLLASSADNFCKTV